MTTPIVPATTTIRRSRVGNIDTDRLLRRQAHLVAAATDFFQECQSRAQFRNRADELYAIENELDLRGASYTRRTLTRRQHLALSGG